MNTSRLIADDKKLFNQYKKQKCDSGQAQGCYLLGYMYQQGEGVKQDYLKAAKYYEISCDSRHATGCFNLGYRYVQGYGVAVSYDKALGLYKKACEIGNALSCNSFKILYEKSCTNRSQPLPFCSKYH